MKKSKKKSNQKNEIKPNILGIDFGTINSRIGIWRNDKVDIIPNANSNSITSSITFTNNEIIIGNNPKINEFIENTIYDIKKLIGKKFSDEIIQKSMKLWNFKVEGDKDNNPLIIVNIKNERKEYHPENILSLILTQLKKSAEEYIGKEINESIIAVPFYFDEEQKNAIIKSGELAGFNVVNIIKEPIAACIGYGYNNKIDIDKKICVFDFGGGALDITILKINEEKFEILYSVGNSDLGGQYIDNILVEFCIKEFKEVHNIDISNNKKALRRLKEKCHQIKHALSLVNEDQIIIESIVKGIDLEIKIDRDLYNELCGDIFNQCINLLKDAIFKSGLKNNEIDNIILVGGSSKIPKIQEMIKNNFNVNNEKERINTDEAIVLGTAILGIENEILKKFKK